jgi:hypothetical protein
VRVLQASKTAVASNNAQDDILMLDMEAAAADGDYQGTPITMQCNAASFGDQERWRTHQELGEVGQSKVVLFSGGRGD